jgi:hypothetical protein
MKKAPALPCVNAIVRMTTMAPTRMFSRPGIIHQVSETFLHRLSLLMPMDMLPMTL